MRKKRNNKYDNEWKLIIYMNQVMEEMTFADKVRWLPGVMMLLGFVCIIAGVSAFGFMRYYEAWGCAFAGVFAGFVLFALAVVSKAAIRYLDRTQNRD